MILKPLMPGLLFDVAAELKAHRGQYFCGKVVFAARRKPLEQRSGQNGRRRSGFDGGEYGPAAFAGIGDAAGKAFQSWLLEKRNRGQIEQPRCDHAAAAPYFRNVGKIEIVLIVFRIAQWCGFRIGFTVRFPRVSVLENVQTLGVSGHQAVFDAVVDHFDEVAGAGGTTVKVTLLRGAGHLIAAGSALHVAAPRRKRLEDGIETLYDGRLAANHLAIAAFEAPDAAAGTDIAIVDSLGGEFFGAANVIDVVRISTIDHGVAGLEFADQIV